MRRGRPKIYTDEELKEHRLAGAREWRRKDYAKNPKKYQEYCRNWHMRNSPDRPCIYCGENLKGTRQRVICKKKECQRRKTNEYHKKYRDSHPDKIKQWAKTSAVKQMIKFVTNRPLNRCRYCLDLIGDGTNYRTKICANCRRRIFIDASRKYYQNNIEKEAKRKAEWFQKNKRIISLRMRARELLQKLERIEQHEIQSKTEK